MLPVALLALSLVSVEPNLVYAKVDGLEMAMDIYRPTNQTEIAPAVVVIHGGGWMSGKRQDMAVMGRALAEQGFVAATVSYRLAPTFKWPAMIDDTQTAVRYLRANAATLKIDPNRIGAAGASAGGHLALLLGTRDTRDSKPKDFPGYSSKVEAVVDLFGPTDANNDFSTGFGALVQLLFGKNKTDAATDLMDFSPINHVSKDDAPIFIFHGKADTLVPIKQSERLAARCKEVGLPCEAVYVEGVGHEVPMQKPEVRAAMQKAMAWLKKYLGQR